MSRKGRIISQPAKKCSIIFGLVYAGIGFAVRICTNNPYAMIHTLGVDEYIPPLWIFNLLCLFWLFISGSAAGRVCCDLFSSRSGKAQISSYQGLLFFLSLFFLSLLWYPLFFGGLRLSLSLLISVICIICSAGCGICWSATGPYPVVAMLANALWLFYIMIVNLLTLLCS